MDDMTDEVLMAQSSPFMMSRPVERLNTSSGYKPRVKSTTRHEQQSVDDEVSDIYFMERYRQLRALSPEKIRNL